jgi:Zn-dependent peptidase ImmA (M78 family)
VARPTKVPITPAVAAWAIRESGYSFDALAEKLAVTPETIRAWMKGTERPSLTEFHRLASVLKRPEASFFLPEAPAIDRPAVEFRHPSDSTRADLSPEELVHLREAARLQRTLSWVLKEMDSPPVNLPQTALGTDVEQVALETRRRLGITASQQLKWRDSAEALKAWRGALENVGVLVFLLPMGEQSCRGFSLWDRYAPLIAVNTWWNSEARSFTLFHEFGHLLTRTASVCTASRRPALRGGGDPAERWCERFAAAVLLPWTAVTKALRARGWEPGTPVEDLSDAAAIARQFKASLRATVLRLIDRGVATWDLYDKIPPLSDHKSGGGGGQGRNRRKIREDEYGRRTHDLLSTAVSRDILSRTDVVGLLDVPDVDLDELLGSSGT